MSSKRHKRMQVDENRRAHVLKLLDKGLILQTEAAAELGVSRQLVHWWCQTEHIDAMSRRRRYLRGLMRDHR